MTSSNNNSSTFDSILSLCRNHEGLPESELLSRLGPIVETNPDALQEKYSPNGRGFSRLETGFTLLHFAAANRSPQFCEILVNSKPDLLRNSDNGIGILPFHSTCMRKGRVETAKYLLSLYPESINFPARNPGGDYPIECVAIAFGGRDHDDNAIELVKFLLKHERALSTPSGYDRRPLPLHQASGRRVTSWAEAAACLAICKLLFDCDPEAIYRTNNRGKTPLDIQRRYRNREMVAFFERQTDFHRQAIEDRTPDNNGQLPIHRALENSDVSLGAIKLMVSAYPYSTDVADNEGRLPLHIACQVGNNDAAKYLIPTNPDSFKIRDMTGNPPLHLACLRGMCELIPCILKQSPYGVNVQNKDNRLPIELLLFDSECDRDCIQYVEAVRCLFEASPIDTLKRLVGVHNNFTALE